MAGSQSLLRTPFAASAAPTRVDPDRFKSFPFKVVPGVHRVDVGRGSAAGDRTFVTVDTAPCKRDYINAKCADPNSHEWEPVVDHVETISDCKVP